MQEQIAKMKAEKDKAHKEEEQLKLYFERKQHKKKIQRRPSGYVSNQTHGSKSEFKSHRKGDLKHKKIDSR